MRGFWLFWVGIESSRLNRSPLRNAPNLENCGFWLVLLQTRATWLFRTQTKPTNAPRWFASPKKGWRFCQDANTVRLEIESEFEPKLGRDGLDALKVLLEQLTE